MSDELLYTFIFLTSVLLSSISQVLLKRSARKTYDNKIKEYLNPLVVFAYLLFFMCTFITMIAYRKIPLSLGPILESTGYIFVSILGIVFLNENISKKKAIGMAIIIIGVIIFSL